MAQSAQPTAKDYDAFKIFINLHHFHRMCKIICITAHAPARWQTHTNHTYFFSLNVFIFDSSNIKPQALCYKLTHYST